MASPRLAAEKSEMSLAKNNEDRVDVFVSINTCHGYNNKAEYLYFYSGRIKTNMNHKEFRKYLKYKVFMQELRSYFETGGLIRSLKLERG